MYHYSYSYTTRTIPEPALSAILPGLLIGALIWLVICLVLSYVLTHKVYEKGGYPGWAALIPFYNTYVLYKMSDVNVGLFVISIFLPIVNIYLYIELAKKFGQGAAFGVLTFLFAPICLAILGYGNYTFEGDDKTNKTSKKPQTKKKSA